MSSIELSFDGAVAIVRMDDGKANALSPASLDDLEPVLDALEGSDHGAVVLMGRPRVFGGGLDLRALQSLGRPEMTAFLSRFSRAMVRLYLHDRPVVAALRGHAVAGGCVVALQADHRVASDDPSVRIGLNEVTLGIGLPSVVLETARARLPPGSWTPVALEGRLFDPLGALSAGLVDELAPTDEVERRAIAWASTQTERPRDGTAHAKRWLRAAVVERIESTRGRVDQEWIETWFSTAAQERLRATVERLVSRGSSG